MVPKCFDNFIGIKGACPEDPPVQPPTSGLFIEQLEGVTVEWAAKGTDAGQLSGIDFIKESISNAIIQTKQKLFNTMSDVGFYRPRSDLGYQTIGELDYDNFDAFRTDYMGIRAERTPDCNRLIWRVPSVSVLTLSDQTVDLRIIDGSVVINQTLETIGGVVFTDYIDYIVQSNTVYIEVANGDFSQTKLESKAPSACCGGCQPIGNRYYKTHGWNGSKRTSLSYGLKVDFNFDCDDWGFLCAIRHNLGLAVLYKTGEILARSQRFNERDNFQTLDPVLKAQASFYKNQFKEELQNVIRRLPDFIRNYNAPCFRCEGARRVELIP